VALIQATRTAQYLLRDVTKDYNNDIQATVGIELSMMAARGQLEYFGGGGCELIFLLNNEIQDLMNF
jgi:hypothetical protein